MEQRYILFRSHKIHNSISGSNILTHRGRGSDFSDIWPYVVGDDTRDISWRHSARSDTIQRKMRIEEDAFSIYIIQTINTYHQFYTEESPITVDMFAWALQRELLQSAKKYHYKAQETTLQKAKNIKNAMIFYVTSSLDICDFEHIRGLAIYNDLIVLHVFHPYELNPTDWLLFDWFWLKNKSYRKEFETQQKDIERLILTMDAGYLLLTTDMDITRNINQFFKNRFTQ